jgi:hypothetical protein
MRLNYAKATVAVLWVLAMCAIGVVASVTSVFGWTLVAALALLPPLIMSRLWNDASPSISESIHEAVR